MIPVVEPGPTEIIIVEPEAERADEPELGSGGHARAADGTRVIGNLRLMENNVQARFVFHVNRDTALRAVASSVRCRGCLGGGAANLPGFGRGGVAAGGPTPPPRYT
jgi:hypothetical protein